MQDATNSISYQGKRVGLNISQPKTKVMAIGNTPLPTIILIDEPLETVNDFTYLEILYFAMGVLRRTSTFAFVLKYPLHSISWITSGIERTSF